MSARTRAWKTAEERRRALEASFETGPGEVELKPEGRTTLRRSLELFVLDKRAEGLTEQVLRKYEREIGRFIDFMESRSKILPHQTTAADLTEFRSRWSEWYPSSGTRGKVQERLKGFLRHCYNHQLIDRVPSLTPIKVEEPPTLPLTDDEYGRLLSVLPGLFPGDKGIRVRGLIQAMRHSGLAIIDTVTLKRSEFRKDGAFYRVTTSRQKTGTHVSVPVPPEVAADVLAAMELNVSPEYIFWNTGTGKPQSAVTNWQHDLREVFRAAGMPSGHPHQLRDTFAVALLAKGVPLEEVSKLLGHTSIKTTEKHYAAWVQARQERLDALVMGTWNAEG